MNIEFTAVFILYMVVVIDAEPIRERFLTVARFLDERGRRLVAAAAFAAGYGGIAAVAMATGMAPRTIGRGLKELAQDEPSERVRRPGARHKPAICKRCYGASGEDKASSSLATTDGVPHAASE